MSIAIDLNKLVTVQTGASQSLAILTPFGAAATIIVDLVPEEGEIRLADGVTVVTTGMALTAAQLSGLVYFGAAYDEQASLSTFSYTVFDGGASVTGSVSVGTVPVNGVLPADTRVAYFTAETEELGRELYAINADGTVSLVADINSFGSYSSSPQDFVEFNGVVYFGAAGTTGVELYHVSANGAPAPVSESYPGESFSNYGNAFVKDNALYFTTYSEEDGDQLRRINSDGSTEVVVDISTEAGRAYPEQFIVFNDDIYFTAYRFGLRSINRVNDAGGIDTVYENFLPVNYYDPHYFEFDGALYFNGAIGSSFDLFRINQDGTTDAVADIQSGNFSASLQDFFEFNDRLYFFAQTASDGTELHRLNVDGTVERVLGADGSLDFFSNSYPNAYAFTEFNNALYFTARNDFYNLNNYRQVYRLDSDNTLAEAPDLSPNRGAPQGLTNLTEFNDELYFRDYTTHEGYGLYRINVYQSVERVFDMDGTEMTVVGDALYFSTSTDTSDAELHRLNLDGSVDLVADIEAKTDDTSPEVFISFGGSVYFSGYDIGGLFRLDADGTVRAITYADGTSLMQIESFFEYDGILYFVPDRYILNGRGILPNLLRISAEGFAEIVPVENSIGWSNDPNNFTEFDGRIYFAANSAGGKNEIHTINAEGEVSLVYSIAGGDGDSYVRDFTEFNGALYFSASSEIGTPGRDLYRINEFHSVELVADIPPNHDTLSPQDFYEFDGALYFRAGRQIHRVNADHTVEAVTTAASGTNFEDPADFFEFNGRLYFSAETDTVERELFKLNADGTVSVIADLNSSPVDTYSSDPEDFTVFDGAIYFTAYGAVFGEDVVGRELYRLNSDDSIDLVSDIFAGSEGSDPEHLVVLNGALYFAASAAENDYNIYRVKPGGAVEFVADYADFVDYSYPERFHVFNDAVYFGSYSPLGWDLYRITEHGAAEFVADINASGPFTGPYHFLEYDGSLYFSASNEYVGRELFRLNADDTISLVEDLNTFSGGSSPQDVFAVSTTADATGLNIDGTLGDDILNGTNQDDSITGAGGSDFLRGYAGDDVLDGGLGYDTVSYEYANGGVIAFAGYGATNDGDGGADTFLEIEALIGSAFDDVLYGDGGGNSLSGGAGNDVIDGGAGLDFMMGGVGDDVYFVDASGDVVLEFAGGGTDTVYAAADYVLAENIEIGVNVLTAGTAILTGNAQDNTLIVSSTAEGNSVSGGAGNDLIYALTNTVMYGGDGHDILVLMGDFNYAEGNFGDDVYIDQGFGNVIVEYADAGLDTLYSYAQNVVLGDNIEIAVLVNAGAGVNAVGNAIANTIIGTWQANVISGLAGGDFLIAGGGDDAIIGGEGIDVMQGNDGADSFYYNMASEGGDYIQDWVAADDSFVFNSGAFGFAAGSALIDGTNFISGIDPTATAAQPTFLWDSDDTNLYYDADGSGAGESVLIADLQAFADVTVADFVFI